MDERGFDEFYQSTRHRVVAFLYAICGDRADAQDIAQEAYQRAWQRWSTLCAYDDPEAWVRKVGYRLSLSRWRQTRNRLTSHRRHGPSSWAEPPSENTVAVVAALRKLPPDLRLVTTLHHLLDLPVAEVAHQTGTPVNTVKARLVRARKMLADLLSTEFSEELRHA
ncbi:MAG TPA: SigE family RNA polymerase sigma factor [Micromonosporaceae bacterium]|nr:SigE family RNA polymerase sigma factor [Micromonosporaceae bacterium]